MYREYPDLPLLGLRHGPGLRHPATLEGGKGGGGPSYPDPNVVSSAQTASNEATASFNKGLNLNNYSNPFGSQNSVQTGTGPGGSPVYTTYDTASPELQGQINSLMGQTAQSGAINQNALSGLFGLGNSISPQAAQQAQQQGQKASYDVSMGYLQPQFTQQQASLDSQLANQGLAPGSQAWNNAQTNLSLNQGQQQQEALNNSMLTGAQMGTQNWQNQLSGIGAQAGLYGQEVGIGQTPYKNLATMAGFVPGYSGTGQAAAGQTDVASQYNNQYQSQLANYNAGQANSNATMGALGSAAGMAAMAFF